MTLKIKEARKLAGITQKDLAKQIGVSAGTLSDYESGNHEPKSDVLCAISDICGVTIDFLVGREKEKAPAPSEDSAGENGKLGREDVVKVLMSLGFISEGHDLADSDFLFLEGVINILDAWFEQRRQGV